ncbi:PREDICTED: sialidase-1-like [Branchiostoma belcheri]|uniref:Sialidase-1 n=1 Tax=Branchiostoma belcheri TaxID=7741 RepID=A0A6P5AMF7_BRABE|nr:PREDICTED: sialidase-1-like [Branchiostoma belcheri]
MSSVRLVSMCIVVLCVSCTRPDTQSVPKTKVTPTVVNDTIIWTSGLEGEIHTYRTPSIFVTPNGTLLALSGARKYSSSDAGRKFLAIRRSEDKGKTWLPTSLVLDDGYETGVLNIGTVFADSDSNTLFVMFVYCRFKCEVPDLLLINSTDDGVTWGQPRNINPRTNGTRTFHPSPGYAIRKRQEPHRGRFVVCTHGRSQDKPRGITLLLSDDGAKTWREGGFLPTMPCGKDPKNKNFSPGECQPVELSDGSLLVMIRNRVRCSCHCKAFARSYDGGQTLPNNTLYFDQTLIEPSSQAGLVYHRGVLFFSGPNSSDERVNMTLKWSYDNGTTWEGVLPISNKMAGYSVLAEDPTDDKHLYLIYEKGVNSSVDFVAVTKIQLQN